MWFSKYARRNGVLSYCRFLNDRPTFDICPEEISLHFRFNSFSSIESIFVGRDLFIKRLCFDALLVTNRMIFRSEILFSTLQYAFENESLSYFYSKLLFPGQQKRYSHFPSIYKDKDILG